MPNPNKSRSKYTLFITWLRAGRLKVFFDSGAPGVQIRSELSNDPEMWLELSNAQIRDTDFKALIRFPDGEAEEVVVPWEAVHTLESEAYEEIHVWGDDLRLASDRKNSGMSEMKN